MLKNRNVASKFNDISNVLMSVPFETKENLWSKLGSVEIGEVYPVG